MITYCAQKFKNRSKGSGTRNLEFEREER